MARKKSRKFKSNRERIKERAENREKSTGGGLRYNLPEGVEWYEPGGKKNLISIVPYEVTVNDNPETEKGELDYRRQIFVHYNIGPDGEAVLRDWVRQALAESPFIGETGHPSEKEGGAGATWAVIKY